MKRGWLHLLAIIMLTGCAAAPQIKPFGPEPGEPRAEKIVIEKAARKMTLYKDGKAWKEYKIALGKGGLAPKRHEGDQRTPEGHYLIENRNPQSIYHRSLRINYPNADDMLRAKAMRKKPGSDIMIHGLPNGKGWMGAKHLKTDWTEGCIAVTNEEIEEIWNSVSDGTPVEIRS